MKDCLKQLAGVVAVIGLAVACSSSGGDIGEPNNSFEEAYLVSIGDTVKAAILPKGDEDYFTLTPDSKLSVRLAVQHPDNIKPELKL
ncbi:MAG TPA: hypothetical protein VK112_00750 [Fodinibius sp.]|nr:hypothetical protein [Fodinibius sp.]